MVTLILALWTALAPPIKLPAPTGPYPVGVRILSVVDSARTAREITLQLWYPSERQQHTQRLYVPSMTPDTSTYLRLLADVIPNADVDARPRKGRASVIILATGRSQATYDYTALSEDLASHGYVVVGVNSPQSSRYFDVRGGFHPATFAAAPIELLRQFVRADSFLEPSNSAVSADLMLVAHELPELVATDPVLNGRLTLGSMGMAGHSNGAMAGARACMRTRECRAYLGIEGTQAREVREGGVDRPYGLLISTQSLSYDLEGVFRGLFGTAPAKYIMYEVRGAGHNSATDLLLLRPELFNYDIVPLRGVEIARAVTRAFFDANLRNHSSPQVNLSAYPELTIHTRR